MGNKGNELLKTGKLAKHRDLTVIHMKRIVKHRKQTLNT